MAEVTDWKTGLSATVRFENVENIQKGIEAAGEPSKARAQRAAFAAETEAYKDSHSLEAYKAVCLALSSAASPASPTLLPTSPAPATSSEPSTTIGPYHPCHLIATSPVSSVYHHPHPTTPLAVKLITTSSSTPPHNPAREAAILKSLTHPNIIPLVSTLHDSDAHLILTFPYHPLTLATALTLPSPPKLLPLLHDLFSGLAYLHGKNIIHRDIKPSNLLLTPNRLVIADFGTAWHPKLSTDEPRNQKCLDVGTGAYRAPETLFGDRKYGTELDMWGAGCVMAECLREPHTPLFESRGAHEDGNQLGLILSIFKTLGTPDPTTWPSAAKLPTPPFEMYATFPAVRWETLIPPTSNPEFAGKWEELRQVVGWLLMFEPGYRMEPEAVMEMLELAGVKDGGA
ncbi:hypothetical protein V496_04857 [Pseudogymnoascus sp. VKM F-4515 (FW-2607)]|nr:hypothetical protein V496_04857 [Pseudogymnoascus sp. VKM F-4515 (FW-2607)]